MQRPSSPPATVAVVGVSTVSSGTALAASSDLADAPVIVLPIVCLTAAALGVVRRYVVQQEQRVRDVFTGLARQHARRERELDRREADLAHREEAFQRTCWTTELRIASANARMDQLRDDHAAERQAHAELQVEYRELAREYNEILLESAGERPAQQAHRPPVAVGQTTSAGTSGPRHTPGRRGPRPFLSVIDGQREHQESI